MDLQLQSVLIDFRFRKQKERPEVESAAHFLFMEPDGSMPKNPDLVKVDQIFNKYKNVISSMYETMRDRYNTFYDKFLTEH